MTDRAEDAVRRVDRLLGERREAQHLLAELREGPPCTRHLEAAQRRSRRLRGEAGIVDPDCDGQHTRVRLYVEHACVGIAWPDRVHAVEQEGCPAVPEVPEV